MENLEYLTQLCRKLSKNEIDHFDLITEGNKFKLYFVPSDDFYQKKNQLKFVVLEEILKSKNLSEVQRKIYVDMLETTRRLLETHTAVKRGFPCSLVGCLFRGKRHRDYVNHLERTHSTSAPFQCSFGRTCVRNFDCIRDLKNHVNTFHKSKANEDQILQQNPAVHGGEQFQVSVKCGMLSCGGVVLPSVQELTSHINTTHKAEYRECVFKDCNTKFGPNSVSRNHFRLKHYIPKKVVLKSIHIIREEATSMVDTDPNNDEQVETIDSDNVNDYSENFDVEEEEEEDLQINFEEDDTFFMMAYADFINRLITYKFIPVTSVKEIAAEFLNQSRRSSKSREQVLRNSLSQIHSLTTEQIEQIVKENSNDPFTRAQEQLSSEYQRSKYIEENFKFVKPKEIILNKEEVKRGSAKDVVHYIPIIDALKALLEDPSYNEAIRMAENENNVHNKNALRDVLDGNTFKKNIFFINNPDALALMMYSDGVELTNPLSSGKGKHKIVQLFWSLCEIPRYQRSAIDRIQLGLIFKERLLKKYTQSQIFKALLTDLKTLEVHGIEVREPVLRRVKVGLLLYSADNLEAHTIGGFSACFSSKDICRYYFYSGLTLRIQGRVSRFLDFVSIFFVYPWKFVFEAPKVVDNFLFFKKNLLDPPAKLFVISTIQKVPPMKVKIMILKNMGCEELKVKFPHN